MVRLGALSPHVNRQIVLHMQHFQGVLDYLPATARSMLQDIMADAKKPLRPTAKKNRFGKAWMQQHVNDHWVLEAQRLGYRSRAAFKLAELAEKDRLFRPGMAVVELGSAPGSWSQLLRQRLGRSARIIALDLVAMDPVAGVRFLQADFREAAGLDALANSLDGRKVDLVVSDLAPNLSGVESADQARSVHLGELALAFAVQWLQPGGDFVVKAFQGAGFVEFQRSMQIHFDKVYVRKPKASRDRSRELYLVGKGVRALSPANDKILDKNRPAARLAPKAGKR
jgi:23S rRNA (uridine2552-2'-O)-methyltransferase